MSAPVFEVDETIEVAAGTYLVKVQVEGEGLTRRFFGKSAKQAEARAKIFIAERTEAYHKSLAAVEARRAGRMRQNLRASSGHVAALKDNTP
jgi:DsbC/DsbD-like thiol-disulfide interchange protein